MGRERNGRLAVVKARGVSATRRQIETAPLMLRGPPGTPEGAAIWSLFLGSHVRLLGSHSSETCYTRAR